MEANRILRDRVERRLAELDAEWDVERAKTESFEVAGGLPLTVALARFMASPAASRGKLAACSFAAHFGRLRLHEVAGLMPPLDLLQRLGFRTREEIEAEKQRLLTELDETEAHSRRAFEAWPESQTFQRAEPSEPLNALPGWR